MRSTGPLMRRLRRASRHADRASSRLTTDNSEAAVEEYALRAVSLALLQADALLAAEQRGGIPSNRSGHL
jgi:hypothetical protein